MEIATKEDFKILKEEVISAISKVALETKGPWIVDLAEVKKRTGYSDKVIQSLIDSGKLNPWKESEGSNSKLRFYGREVIELIPKHLRTKYGEPS